MNKILIEKKFKAKIYDQIKNKQKIKFKLLEFILIFL